MREIRPRSTPLRTLVLLLVISLVSAACSASTDTTTTTSGDTGDSEAPATTSGSDDGDSSDSGDDSGDDAREVLVHALESEPLTLDPAQVEFGEIDLGALFHVYERLVEVGSDGPELEPGLATEVPTLENGLLSEDGLTYTFPIREGVVFHDGTEFTAEDVIFSWERVMTMDLPEGDADLLASNIAEMSAPDPQTLVVTLQQPNAAFLNSVVSAMVASIVSPDAVEANGGVQAGEPNEFMTTNMVGTGPYVLGEWNRGENLRFEVNEDYWGEPAQLDVRWEVVDESEVRVLGIKAGDYDIAEADPEFVNDLQSEGVIVYDEGLLVEPIHIGMNLRIPEGALPEEDTIPVDFFHDPRVRQAFNYAYDHQALLAAMNGLGDFNPHYIPIGLFGYDPEAPVYDSYDPDMAETLFREAGWWDEGFTISVITEGGFLFETAALILKDSLERLNPNFQVRVLAVSEAQFDEVHEQDPIPMAMWVKNADPAVDPDAYVRRYIHPDGVWGERHGFRNGYTNPDELASLIDDAARTLDVDERAELYSEIQQLAFEDPMWLIAAQEGVIVPYRDSLNGFVFNPLWPRPSVDWSLMSK